MDLAVLDAALMMESSFFLTIFFDGNPGRNKRVDQPAVAARRSHRANFFFSVSFLSLSSSMAQLLSHSKKMIHCGTDIYPRSYIYIYI